MDTSLIPIFLFLHCISLSHFAEAKHTHSPSTHYHHRTPHLFPNPRLHQAYIALQAWKLAIYSDPQNLTSNWVGPDVCNYTGVYCTASLSDNRTQVVAGIDLNHGDIAGFLPTQLGLLTDLALFHLNSNRFCGLLPPILGNLSLLFEFDVSNNRLVGPFPTFILSAPSLKYLDIRFNEFEGPLPAQLFLANLDAIFLNNNRFQSAMFPPNIARSSASVVVFANNKIGGCIPASIGSLADSLEELLLINTGLSGCLPFEVGFLYKLRVLDVSFNSLVGPIPYSLAGLAHLEQLNVAHNLMTGVIGGGFCELPSLKGFNSSYNYFCEEEMVCLNLTSKGVRFDDRRNCLPERPVQRSKKECTPFVDHPVDCFEYHCGSHDQKMMGYNNYGQASYRVAAPRPSPAPT